MRHPLLPGENDAVVLAAIYDLPHMQVNSPEDADAVALLTDVKRRYDAYELTQAHASHKRWVATLPQPVDLKATRVHLGLTQEQAAALVGVTENTWARWERGEMKIHPARLRDLERLALHAAHKQQADESPEDQ